jgi:hypothetical protein
LKRSSIFLVPVSRDERCVKDYASGGCGASDRILVATSRDNDMRKGPLRWSLVVAHVQKRDGMHTSTSGSRNLVGIVLVALGMIFVLDTFAVSGNDINIAGDLCQFR